MKTVTHLMTRDLEVRRLRTTTGNKKTFQSTATVEGVPIQSYSNIAGQRLGIIEEREFVTWVDIATDVREGDRIVDRGITYTVKEVTRKDYGINTHLEVIMDKANE